MVVNRISVPGKLLLAAIAFAAAAAFFSFGGFVIDDAYISFRYVSNLVEGNGLVYNPGEKVEGYSNFLWIILLSVPGCFFRGDDLVTAARILSLVFNTGTIFLTFRLASSLSGGSRFVYAAPAFLALNYTFAAWGAGGLETPLYTFLVTLSLVLLSGSLYGDGRDSPARTVAAGGVLALVALTRPDGLIFIALGTAAITVLRPGSGKIKQAALLLSAFAVIFVPYFAWRWAYYGWLLPNTFYAKTGGGLLQYYRGVIYSLQNIVIPSNIPFLFPILLLFRGGWKSRFNLLAAAFALAAPAFIIWAGGDGLFGPPRFLMHSLPAFYALAAAGLAHFYGFQTTFARRSAVFLLAAGLLVTAFEHIREKEMEARDYSYSERWRLAGEWLRDNAEPGSLVAVSSAGAVAYYSKLHVIDMIGLTDITIAHKTTPGMGSGRPGHEKGDGAYVLSRKPDYILMCNAWVNPRPLTSGMVTGRLRYVSEKELWEKAEFHERYRLRSVRLDTEPVYTGGNEPLYFSFYNKIGQDD